MVILDGTQYNVRVTVDSLERSFELVEGTNKGTSISGRAIRDVLGTGYSYTMNVEPDPSDMASYNNFYQAISAPVDSHTVTIPYGNSNMTFECLVTSGTDVYNGVLGSANQWKNLVVNFIYMEPQRAVE